MDRLAPFAGDGVSTWACPACGSENGPAARFCANCGTRAPTVEAAAPADAGAVAALALALLTLAGAGTVAAIVLGHRARARIAAADGAVGGRRVALAALGIAYATLACALATGAYAVFIA